MNNKEAINLIARNKSVFQYDEEMIKALDFAIKALEERPKGEWKVIWHKDIYGRWSNYYEYKCSVCHKSYNDYSSGRQTAFCPNCGADMGGKEE